MLMSVLGIDSLQEGARKCSEFSSGGLTLISTTVWPALQMRDGPMFLPLLNVPTVQIDCLMSSKPKVEHDRQACAIPFALQTVAIRRMLESHGLFGREPVTKPNSNILDASNSSNPRGEVGTQQTAIGCLIRAARGRGS